MANITDSSNCVHLRFFTRNKGDRRDAMVKEKDKQG